MCNSVCIRFGEQQLSKEEVENKRVLEVASLNVNGTLKYDILDKSPAEYIGIDLIEGKDVDLICGVEDIIEVFGKESFDIVICTEMLEHVKDWQLAISNLKNVCKPRGIIILTTRGPGFPRHSYPDDFWRFERIHIKSIFYDCEIQTLSRDKSAPGVLLKAVKPENFVEKDLSNYRVYSMEGKKR